MNSRLAGAVRRRLTYANVVATLALFVALGGTAAAAVVITSNSQIGTNTISGHQPTSGKHSNLIAGTVNGSDLAKVTKTALKLHCPTGMQLGGALCFEPIVRNTADYQTAMTTCSNANTRLPTPGEMTQIFDHLGALQPEEWTSTFVIESGLHAMAMGDSSNRQFEYFDLAVSTSINFRCVTTSSN